MKTILQAFQRSFESLEEAQAYAKDNGQTEYMVIELDEEKIPPQLVKVILDNDPMAGPFYMLYEGEWSMSPTKESLN